MLSTREYKGLYYTLLDELCADANKFFNYFHMSKSSFDELLSYIRQDLTGIDTKLRRSIPAEEMLLVTLR